jgi:hypothetical protein
MRCSGRTRCRWRGMAARGGHLFTFLPSFVFILAGGPLVESTRGNLRMTAPLTAISAAVVGVIASLAVFFGPVFFAGGSCRQAIVIGAGRLRRPAALQGRHHHR